MKEKQAEFVWFDGASFDKILADMQTVAADADRRIEFHYNKKHPEDSLVFVEPVTNVAEGGGGTNQSHVCPPQCP